MKNNIKVGEYLRLDNGYIYKWENNYYEWIYEDEGQLVYGNGANEYEWESNIVSHSFNIINLIEVGDYVDGYKVEEIERKKNGDFYIDMGDGCWLDQRNIANNPIESIITKEQFESMEYKIEK